MMYDVLWVVRRARVQGLFPRHPKVRVYNNNIITAGDHATGPRPNRSGCNDYWSGFILEIRVRRVAFQIRCPITS